MPTQIRKMRLKLCAVGAFPDRLPFDLHAVPPRVQPGNRRVLPDHHVTREDEHGVHGDRSNPGLVLMTMEQVDQRIAAIPDSRAGNEDLPEVEPSVATR